MEAAPEGCIARATFWAHQNPTASRMPRNVAAKPAMCSSVWSILGINRRPARPRLTAGYRKTGTRYPAS